MPVATERLIEEIRFVPPHSFSATVTTQFYDDLLRDLGLNDRPSFLFDGIVIHPTGPDLDFPAWGLWWDPPALEERQAPRNNPPPLRGDNNMRIEQQRFAVRPRGNPVAAPNVFDNGVLPEPEREMEVEEVDFSGA